MSSESQKVDSLVHAAGNLLFTTKTTSGQHPSANPVKVMSFNEEYMPSLRRQWPDSQNQSQSSQCEGVKEAAKNLHQSQNSASVRLTDHTSKMHLQLRNSLQPDPDQSIKMLEKGAGPQMRHFGQQVGEQSKTAIGSSFMSYVSAAPRVPMTSYSTIGTAAHAKSRVAPHGVKMSLKSENDDAFTIQNASKMDINASHFDDQMGKKGTKDESAGSRSATPKMNASAVMEKTDKKVYKVKLHTIDGERDIECPEDMAVLYAAEEAPNIVHYEMPRLCRWGDCGACVGKILNGTVDQSAGEYLTEEEKKRGYVLTCVAKPTSDDVEIVTEKYKQIHRERNPNYRYPFHDSEVEAIADLSSSGTSSYPLNYHWP